MHTYCRGCISRWLAQRRSCPLCKQRVTTLLHSIRSDASYEEQLLPPSPKQPACWEGGSDAAESILDRLQAFFEAARELEERHRPPPQPVHGSSQQQQQPCRGPDGHGGAQRSGWGGHGGRQDPRQQEPQQSQQQGPRPYFFRLQQRLRAGGLRPGWGHELSTAREDDGPLTEEQAILLWRRQFYEQVQWVGGWVLVNPVAGC